jgi:uncharacterized membrane protein YccF (DUF307 family)
MLVDMSIEIRLFEQFILINMYRFCLDPIPRETYSDVWTFDYHTSPWSNPIHPFTCIANVIWLVFFGWEIVLLFWAVAIIQALTVIGIGSALQMFELSLFAL